MCGTPHRSRRTSTGSRSPGRRTSPSTGGRAAPARSRSLSVDSLTRNPPALLEERSCVPAERIATRRADIMGLPTDQASHSTSARPWLANYPPTVPHSLEPYPEGSLYSFLEDAARRHPNAPAISFWLPGSPMGKWLSYRHLLGQVERFSGVLTSLGVRRGDRVGLVLPN